MDAFPSTLPPPKRQDSGRSVKSNGSAIQKRGGPTRKVQTPVHDTVLNGHTNHVKDGNLPPTSDYRYLELWKAHQSVLVDPSDIHSAMEGCMSRMTNTLSPTQVTFLQRKVRSVVRSSILSHEKGNRMFRGTSNPSLEQETKFIADKFHLLSRHAVRKVLPKSSIPGDTEPQDPNGDSDNSQIADNVYLLALFLHESLWDRVAAVAAQSAVAAGAEVDVNKHKLPETIPTPILPTTAAILDLPAGISLHALTFLISLALSKLVFVYPGRIFLSWFAFSSPSPNFFQTDQGSSDCNFYSIFFFLLRLCKNSWIIIQLEVRHFGFLRWDLRHCSA